MGSELDDADSEVKWFTDVAYRSLSSPQVDYLDMYNSSHRSSTNVSHPSTNVDSPGAVAWMTYADLRGSTLCENNDLLHSTRRFEIGGFECVEVAVETKEEYRGKKRTVPKRQIQLLRRNTDESKPKANTENVLDLVSTHRHSKDIFVHQHSTPTFVQEEMSQEKPDSPRIDRKISLQKSLSLDDALPTTEIASCIIKSALSKKMQDAQKETSGITDLSPTGDINKNPGISPSSFDAVQSKMEKHSISSSQHSECTISSESLAVWEKRSPQLMKCALKVSLNPILTPEFINTGEANITREERTPRMAHPFEDKELVKQNSNNRKEGGGGILGEHYKSDSANVRSTSAAVATQTATVQSRMTNRTTERQMAHGNQKQHDGKSVCMSKNPEITLKPSIVKEKKTSSLKVSLSPDLERSKEMCEHLSMDKAAEDIKAEVTTSVEDANKTSVIHKVRDIRNLIKNTYNLSFKASNSASTVEDAVIQEKREKPPQTPPALHIECKAVSCRDKQALGSRAIHWQGETQAVDISKISQPWLVTETSSDTDITEITSSLPKILTIESKQKATDSQCTIFGGLSKPVKTTEKCSSHCDQNTLQGLPPRPPSKDREVSALGILEDGTSKTIQNSTIADSNQITATSSSHTVSMLLKEKEIQADIGVYDVTNVGVSATAKHVNRLEIPLQACLSEAQTLDKSVLRTSQSQDGPQFKPKQHSESPKQVHTEESSVEQRHEQEKTATTTLTQIPTNITTSCKPEVRSISTHIKNNAVPATASKQTELPIKVRSISSDRLKPFFPPKPNCNKQSFAEIKSLSSDPPKPDPQTTSVMKQQLKLTSEPKKNDMPATLIHKDQLNEVLSNNTKKLAVSAVSSYEPPPIPVTTTPRSVQKSTTTFASVDQQQSSAFLQTTSNPQQITTSFIQEQSILASSFTSNPSIKPTHSQAYSHTKPVTSASSKNRSYAEDYHLYASDDPPSYDERESFSPLCLSDLPPQRLCRYHLTSKQSVSSSTQTSHSHLGYPQHRLQGRTPPASQSPGQVFTSPCVPPQAQVRPRQCRPDSQALNYLPVPSNATVPPASALIQPLHHPQACLVPNTQTCWDDQSQASELDRQPANHHSLQAVGPASYHDYAHSANMSALDPRPQLFNTQDLPPSFGHDYGNKCPVGATVLYPENASGISCGQAPRRVFLNPDTGKYFYIDVPVQPLRKMLFDPELGQYVEVLIPQQTMSHPRMYPSAAPQYSSLHNPGLYAPQYLPYALSSYPTIPSSAQQVRHPEVSPIPTTLHQPSLRHGSPASQVPKNEPKGHPSLDQSYLESMYYIPTVIDANHNSAPLNCYHKPFSSMSLSGGKRL